MVFILFFYIVSWDFLPYNENGGTWLTQLVEHVSLDLKVMSLSHIGCKDYLKVKKKAKS